ncbi:hypothetical protein ACLKA7_001765 [Drosophila subpalustris]
MRLLNQTRTIVKPLCVVVDEVDREAVVYGNGRECDIPVAATPALRKAYGGTQIATLALQPSIASKLLESGKVRIGWVVCRIRRKIDPKRCFKCMGLGHTSTRCRSQQAVSKETCWGKSDAIRALSPEQSLPGVQEGIQSLKRWLSSCSLTLIIAERPRTCSRRRYGRSILTLPCLTAKQEGEWHQSTDGKAAIWSCGQPPCQLTQRLARNGFARAKCGDIFVYSCYIAPSVSLTEYGAIIDDIAQDARGKASVIIAGDFNAWATEWGSKSTTPRGSTLLDTFASLQVCLLNTGTKSTFSKAGRESIIDVTFASPLLARGSEWCVSDIYTHSDHLAVLTTLAPSGCHSARAFIHESYKTESLDMDCLLSMVSGLSVRGDANSSAEAMADGISAACNASMAKVRRGGNRHRPVAWWNEEIAVARMECHAARRRLATIWSCIQAGHEEAVQTADAYLSTPA